MNKNTKISPTELKPCPFCGGKAKVSFRNYKYYGKSDFGDVKKSYIVQVFCKKCKSRGKPIATDWLINPNPWQMDRFATPNTPCKKQADKFSWWVEKAIEAWNERAKDGEQE